MRARGRLDNQKSRLCAREAEALWLEKSNRKLEIDKNWVFEIENSQLLYEDQYKFTFDV